MEELAKQQEYIRANAAEIVGQNTLEAIVEVQTTAPDRYKADVEQIAESTRATFGEAMGLARELAGAQWDALEQQGAIPSAENPGGEGLESVRYRIFISQRMPGAEVKALVEAFRGRPDVALVLRGLLPGQKLLDLQQWIAGAIGEIAADTVLPNITLDPEPYTDLGVDHVPVIARYDDAGKLVGFASGVTSPEWLQSKLDDGARGNLGVFGAVRPVAEEDLIQVLMARAKAYDWAGAAAGALDRYWARLPSTHLPKATEDRTRVLDPSVELTEDVVAPAGQVIARRGDRINPLEAVPFQQTILVVDPSDSDQLTWARSAIKERGGLSVMVLATELRTVGSLEGVGALSDSLGARVYLLQPDVVERFAVERVPTLIRAEGTVFIIEEQTPRRRQ